MKEKVAKELSNNLFLFTNIVFRENYEVFHGGDYIKQVCDFLQYNKKTVRIGPKDHFKSSSLYTFLMWEIWRAQFEGGFGCFYFSYDRSQAFYHLSKLKLLIKSNPYFQDLVDYKTLAEGLLKFSWNGKDFCVIKPKGLLCLRGDQKVFTTMGEKQISEVNIGELVFSRDGKQHKVLNVLNKPIKENLVEIKVRNLVDTIVASKEHKILAIKNPKCFQNGSMEFCFPYCSRKDKHCKFKSYPELKWLEAGNLERGDIVVYPKIKGKIEPPYTKDVLRLFGYYLAEGCLNLIVDRKGRKRGGRVRWTINSGEKSIMEDIQNIVRKYFSGSVSSFDKKGENCKELTTINVKLCKMLEKEFGHGARNKRIPVWMENIEFDYFWEFLKGYWLGDGYKNSPSFSICSANKNILRSIQRALFNFNISSSIIKFDSCKEKGLVAFRLESKSKRLLEMAGKKADPKTNVQRIWFDENYCYLPIKKVSEILHDGFVWDLTIEDKHNYIANSVLVSNSFKRGIHEKIILVDDPFQDPANLLDPVIVKKINEIFKTQIMDMPFIDTGRLHAVMTPQTNDDFCFDSALMERVKVLSQPAEYIDKETNEKKALWPEHMPLAELEIRRRERGDRVYMKEYMCLGEGTKIITPDGFKKIEDIKVGDDVLGNGKFVKVLHKFNTEAKELIKLQINRSENNIIEATENHPFLIIAQKGKSLGGKKGFYFIPSKHGFKKEWKNAGYLRRGDIVCFPRLQRSEEEIIKISDDALELAGWYVSEGYSNDYTYIDSRSWLMGIAQKDLNVRLHIRDIVKNVWNYEAGISKWEVRVLVADIIKYYHYFFGGKAGEKKLPDWFFNLTERQFNIFFSSLFKGDGHEEVPRNAFVYTTKSETLACQLIVLLRKFGKPASMIKENNGMFSIRWNKKPIYVWMDENYFYARILRIGKRTGDFKTFNLSTEDQTFCTNLCLVHNCQPGFSADTFWSREKVERMLDVSLFHLHELKTENTVCAGWDVGKFRHPAHITIFERVGDIWIQRFQQFMDGWDYSAQVEEANSLVKRFKIDFAYFDATGREIESFRERKILNPIWKPVIFKTETKWRMVNNMEGLREKGRLKLIPNSRQTNQLLVVNNSLQAFETIEGHGEPFFSMAMALLAELEFGRTPIKSIGIIPRKKVSPFGRHFRG